jgi:hypothetical protein
MNKVCYLFYNFFIILLIGQAAAIQAQSRYGKPLAQNTITSITSTKEILYNGIDNLLVIDSLVYSQCDTILLQSSNGYILADTLNTFLCYPEKPGDLYLTLFSISENDTTVMGFKSFPVKNIPEPQLTLNTQPINTPVRLPKSVLINCDSLGIFFSEDINGSESWVKITEFSLGYIYGGYYVSHHNPSNKILKSTKDIINQLGPEKELSIKIKVRSEGKIIKQLPIYRIRVY